MKVHLGDSNRQPQPSRGKERERDRKQRDRLRMCVLEFVRVNVCARQREWERKNSKREREREGLEEDNTVPPPKAYYRRTLMHHIHRKCISTYNVSIQNLKKIFNNSTYTWKKEKKIHGTSFYSYFLHTWKLKLCIVFWAK